MAFPQHNSLKKKKKKTAEGTSADGINNCAAYSISSVVDTRDWALSLLQGTRIHEVVSRCLPHQRSAMQCQLGG